MVFNYECTRKASWITNQLAFEDKVSYNDLIIIKQVIHYLNLETSYRKWLVSLSFLPLHYTTSRGVCHK